MQKNNFFFCREINRVIFYAEKEHEEGDPTTLGISRRDHVTSKIIQHVSPAYDLLREVLNSDMAQREEDEGQKSELLQRIRELVVGT